MSSEEKTTPCTVRDILSAMDDCVPAGAMPVMHAASKEDNDKEGAHYRSVMNLTPAMASQWCAFYAVLADVPPSTVASESTRRHAQQLIHDMATRVDRMAGIMLKMKAFGSARAESAMELASRARIKARMLTTDMLDKDVLSRVLTSSCNAPLETVKANGKKPMSQVAVKEASERLQKLLPPGWESDVDNSDTTASSHASGKDGSVTGAAVQEPARRDQGGETSAADALQAAGFGLDPTAGHAVSREDDAAGTTFTITPRVEGDTIYLTLPPSYLPQSSPPAVGEDASRVSKENGRGADVFIPIGTAPPQFMNTAPYAKARQSSRRSYGSLSKMDNPPWREKLHDDLAVREACLRAQAAAERESHEHAATLLRKEEEDRELKKAREEIEASKKREARLKQKQKEAARKVSKATAREEKAAAKQALKKQQAEDDAGLAISRAISLAQELVEKEPPDTDEAIKKLRRTLELHGATACKDVTDAARALRDKLRGTLPSNKSTPTAPPPGVTLTAPPPERYAHRSPAQSPVLPRPPPPPIDVTSDGAGSSSSHAASPLYESQTPIPEEDAKLCVVCLDWERTFAVVPCGHHCLCQDCLDKVLASDRQCPVCREPMQGIGAIRIYF